jgi:23S rRNA (guanosine2251-2'-O)-methyltransferase
MPKNFPLAVIFGNENKGMGKRLNDGVDFSINIPMLGQTESLNVGVAAGIVLYQLALFAKNL